MIPVSQQADEQTEIQQTLDAIQSQILTDYLLTDRS